MASIKVGVRGGSLGTDKLRCCGEFSTQDLGWEADARDERSLVESLNRWEKTISLYRTASGEDISNGILAATVLEHSPESYQNILKQVPFNVRASYSAIREWLREYAKTLRRYDGTSGSSGVQPQSTGLVPMEVDQTRAVSGFSSRTDGRGKSKGKCKSKDGKGKGKGKKGDKGKDQKPQAKTEQFQGYCGYCEKWGHKRAECRKRFSDGKSKGGAAAASADNDGDVAAVMDDDDFALDPEGHETLTGWCLGVSSMVLGSIGSLLLDSGSDEHLCSPKFADLIPTDPDRSLLKLKDVQQNDLTISGQKILPLLVGPSGGKHAMEATATFRVAEVRDNILSLGKLVRKGFHSTLGPRGCSMERDGKSVPLYLERSSLRVEAHVLQRASKPGYVAAGSAVTDDHIKDVNVKQSHTSSGAGSAGKQSAEVPTALALVLRTWSTIKELHLWLRELGAPIYGTKDELFRRLCEYEQIAARKKQEEEYLENRRKELGVATQPVTPKILPGPAQPSEVERQHHLVNLLPPAPWCELCVHGPWER